MEQKKKILSILEKTLEIEETLADIVDNKKKFNETRIISDLKTIEIILNGYEIDDRDILGFAQTRYLIARDKMRELGINVNKYDEKYYQLLLSGLNLGNIQN